MSGVKERPTDGLVWIKQKISKKKHQLQASGAMTERI
jgi:hypothetical protein